MNQLNKARKLVSTFISSLIHHFHKHESQWILLHRKEFYCLTENACWLPWQRLEEQSFRYAAFELETRHRVKLKHIKGSCLACTHPFVHN